MHPLPRHVQTCSLRPHCTGMDPWPLTERPSCKRIFTAQVFIKPTPDPHLLFRPSRSEFGLKMGMKPIFKVKAVAFWNWLSLGMIATLCTDLKVIQIAVAHTNPN